MPSPMGLFPPAPTPPLPVWNARNAATLCSELDRTAVACNQAQAALRHEAARATVEWRGPSKFEFDTRLARLVGALSDVEQLAGIVAAQVRAHDAQVAHIRQTLGVSECTSPLNLLCTLSDPGR